MSEPLYFLAGGMRDAEIAVSVHDSVLVPVNAIKMKKDISKIEKWVDDGVRVIIDSGAFDLCASHARNNRMPLQEVFGMPPEAIDGFASLLDQYRMVATLLSDKVFACVEIDLGGKVRKRETRAALETNGVRVSPVFHPIHDGWEYLDELAAGYDMIFVGNLVDASTRERESVMCRLSRWKAVNPDKWLHLLGVTPSPLLLGFNPDSCDSSSWLSGVRQFSAWRAYACYDRVGGFCRDMAYIPGDVKASRQKAMQVAAMDHHCQALGLADYFHGVHEQCE